MMRREPLSPPMSPPLSPPRSPGPGLRSWLLLERLAAAGVLLAGAPLLALLALWIRLDSPGPVLFRQARLGRDAVPFELLKFRTMRTGIDDELPQAQRAVVSSGDDPRITRAGRFLRKTSLDELPQLWVVVRGRMALVGPRPILPEQRRAMPAWAEVRFQVRPGLTGLAQVKGRRSLGWIDQLRWDRVFVRRDSVSLRAWIVLRTFGVLFRPETVYGDPGKNWRAWLPESATGTTGEGDRVE